MRLVFLLLVLANLVFFAWANFFSENDTQSDPRPTARQVSPEKLRVLPPEPASKPEPSLKPVADVSSANQPKACIEVGGFTTADAGRAAQALSPLGLGARLTQRQTDEAATWWVFISPRATRADAQKKATELKALGIDDYFIVQDESPLKNAVSLGIFKSEAAANSRLEALRVKGVKTAQTGARDATLQKTWFQVRGADEALAVKLRGIAQPFPGAEVRDCAAAPLNGGAGYLPNAVIAATAL